MRRTRNLPADERRALTVEAVRSRFRAAIDSSDDPFATGEWTINSVAQARE
jgi:hypothetical protein